ncbi:MAG TPA: hypothetical protein VNW97_05290 [Candidatus Saccharimonadales bacterium]|jgi:hypothetical protein|nr:hypothetical protein [Candidatus Saccharimonadales bacterium]
MSSIELRDKKCLAEQSSAGQNPAAFRFSGEQASGPAINPDSPTSQGPYLRAGANASKDHYPSYSRNRNPTLQRAPKKQNGPEILKSLSQIFNKNRVSFRPVEKKSGLTSYDSIRLYTKENPLSIGSLDALRRKKA